MIRLIGLGWVLPIEMTFHANRLNSKLRVKTKNVRRTHIIHYLRHFMV